MLKSHFASCQLKPTLALCAVCGAPNPPEQEGWPPDRPQTFYFERAKPYRCHSQNMSLSKPFLSISVAPAKVSHTDFRN